MFRPTDIKMARISLPALEALAVKKGATSPVPVTV
jgi:hypothetical protein